MVRFVVAVPFQLVVTLADYPLAALFGFIFIYQRTWLSAIAAILGLYVNGIINSVSTNRASSLQLYNVLQVYLLRSKEYFFHRCAPEVDNLIRKALESNLTGFLRLRIIKLNYLQAGLDHNDSRLIIPLDLAQSSPKTIKGVKAFPAYGAPSVIILSTDGESLGPIDEFYVLHETFHCSDAGIMNTDAAAARVITIPLLSFAVFFVGSSWPLMAVLVVLWASAALEWWIDSDRILGECIVDAMALKVHLTIRNSDEVIKAVENLMSGWRREHSKYLNSTERVKLGPSLSIAEYLRPSRLTSMQRNLALVKEGRADAIHIRIRSHFGISWILVVCFLVYVSAHASPIAAWIPKSLAICLFIGLIIRSHFTRTLQSLLPQIERSIGGLKGVGE